MAFTLIGTGTTIAKTIDPKSNTDITANACDLYNGGGHTRYKKLNRRSSERIGNRVYLYQHYLCDCQIEFKVIVQVHSC